MPAQNDDRYVGSVFERAAKIILKLAGVFKCHNLQQNNYAPI